MSEEQIEPGELTERFRAFSQSSDPEPSRALPAILFAAGAAVVLVLIAAIVWIILAN